jgi:hypothetical protein
MWSCGLLGPTQDIQLALRLAIIKERFLCFKAWTVGYTAITSNEWLCGGRSETFCLDCP